MYDGTVVNWLQKGMVRAKAAPTTVEPVANTLRFDLTGRPARAGQRTRTSTLRVGPQTPFRRRYDHGHTRRPVQPRIMPMQRADADPEVEELYALMEAMGNPPPNMHLTFGRHPALYAKWLPFATHVIPASSLAPRDRQILILRCAFNWRCGYAWAQHVHISRRLDVLSDREIDALQGRGSLDWDDKEAALINACDEVARSMDVGDPTWAVLVAHSSEPELLDIVFTIGQYALISIALRTLRVRLDDGLMLPQWAATEDQ
jgi:alkylhydroperoxidase family enzyme